MNTKYDLAVVPTKNLVREDWAARAFKLVGDTVKIEKVLEKYRMFYFKLLA